MLELLFELCPDLRHERGPDGMLPLFVAVAKGNRAILEAWKKHAPLELEAALSSWSEKKEACSAEAEAEAEEKSNEIEQLYKTFPDCNIPSEEASSSPGPANTVHFGF